MESHYADLFRITFMLNCFLFFSFAGVNSAPVTLNIIDVMKNDSKLCPTSKFLYESEIIKLCASVTYPTAPWNYNPDNLTNFLCLGVYDTAYKICQYSSQLPIPLNNTATFDLYLKKYVPNENEPQEEFCSRLQGLTSLYNNTEINQFWKPLVKNLNIPHTCFRICFDFHDKFRPLCAVLAWIKSIDDDMVKRANKVETKHNLVATDKTHISQSKEEIVDIKITPIESKKIETKESKKQDEKQITLDSNKNNNDVKGSNLNIPGNAPLADGEKLDDEKTKSDTGQANNIQKKVNSSLETQAHKGNKESSIVTEFDTNAELANPMKGISPNGDSQIPSRNVNNKVINEENAEKSKEQDIDSIKPSTISENTQEHYDAGNPDDNMENDGLDDVDETIQHPDTGNQNEHIQEASEQKNNNARITEYSNMRTEDDSHFFTYFTVITLACLAGYIGYHNKQKILAIVLEGRRSRNNRGRRRPSTASYRKLDCTLEEAVTSQCNANVTHVIY
ncbi:trans-Golgi network integral membrane protein 1 [Monomorium pharaonis]|uniref:trans-Golgi network integral membrane protein 1 n=1 Tax=Monomorium pharaonis TaxID=307658 RepID=UPI00063F5577|nr:trans-Golgi network integral membrane protein 1 [Monomorium pharaonis]